jgi:enediyne biosynthesis protein E4
MSRGFLVLLSCLVLTSGLPAARGEINFVDATESSGLLFNHRNGMVGERWLLEVNGAGVGLLDFDADGLLDIWMVQGGPIAEHGGKRPGDRLYRNISSAGKLLFTDITDTTGVSATAYGMGIATGDIDDDGDLDVFLANYGANQLFENQGNGQFRDVTAAAGVAGNEWSAGASFVDFDEDGMLDLYVVNYVDFTLATHQSCLDLAGRPTYCAPTAFTPQADRLYRNLGDGRFADVSGFSGISQLRRSGLGVVAADFNNDGRADFYVANDAMDNSLWLNQGGGLFTDQALLSGVAVNGNGEAEASMGIAAEDYDRDCDVDLFVTHLAAETNTLYVNEGNGKGVSDGTVWFVDGSNQAGIAASSSPFTGFGAAWFDADNDGDLDLMSANGAVTPLAKQVAEGSAHPLRQRNQLWANSGTGTFSEVDGGPAFELKDVSRGAAFGDLDNDGDIDIVLSNNNGPARIYENRSPAKHWLGLQSAGGIAGKARIESASCGYQRFSTDGSYASASDARVVIGLGSVAASQRVRVKWSDAMQEVFGPLKPDRYHVIKRGDGRKPADMQ